MKNINISREDLYKMYITENNSTKKIAEKIGCNCITILNKLRKFGIEIKQRNGKFQEKFYVNDSFFEYWSSNMAYILGYISADGCVRYKKYELKIKSIDYELLEHVQKSLKTNYQIKKEKNTNCYCLAIYNKKIVEDLGKLGIHERKSLTVKFPNIPDEFFWDYLRGEVDGDGCIFPPGGYQKCKTIGMNIVGNREYLNILLNKLVKKINCTKYKIRPSGKAAELAIHGKNCVSVLKNLYFNDKYGLNRKKDLAYKAVEFYEKEIKKECSICCCVFTEKHTNEKYCDNCRLKVRRNPYKYKNKNETKNK